MNKYILKFFSCDFCDLEIEKKEICRYMGIKGKCDDATDILIDKCINSIANHITLKLCYMFLPVKTENNKVSFEILNVKSSYLSKNMSLCSQCILFGATIGTGIDRLIAKNANFSPVTALAYQAIGTEIIEKLCDKFESFIKKEYNISLKPRFSPGYADFELNYQREIFNLLQLEKNCGITLTDSFIMRPSKSVTAFIGIGDCKKTDNKCIDCENINCEYKKEL